MTDTNRCTDNKFLEYENALVEEFVKQKLYFEEQKRINIYSVDSGKVLGIYVPDFVNMKLHFW